MFWRPSIVKYCAAAYVAVHEPSSISQKLISSKSRLSKAKITIPSLQLIATHLSANLDTNIRETLKKISLRSVTDWTNSAVVLNCLNEKENYKVL